MPLTPWLMRSDRLEGAVRSSDQVVCLLKLAQGSPAQPGERPASPCIKVCALGSHGYCTGCLRTGEEIGRWMTMSPAEQWQLCAELEQRRSLLEERATYP